MLGRLKPAYGALRSCIYLHNMPHPCHIMVIVERYVGESLTIQVSREYEISSVDSWEGSENLAFLGS